MFPDTSDCDSPSDFSQAGYEQDADARGQEVGFRVVGWVKVGKSRSMRLRHF